MQRERHGRSVSRMGKLEPGTRLGLAARNRVPDRTKRGHRVCFKHTIIMPWGAVY